MRCKHITAKIFWLIQKNIQITSYNTITDDKTNIVMLYDSNMQPIEDAIRFINFGGMTGQSQNYKRISNLKCETG